MLNEEDYSSDTSDEDFVPQGAESDDEEDPISDNVSDNDNDESKVNEGKKRKQGKAKSKKKNPLLGTVDCDEEVKNGQSEDLEIKEQNSKKEEDLWTDFLAEVDEKPTPSPKPKPTKSWAHLLGNNKYLPQSTSEANNSTAPSQSSTEGKVARSDPVKPTTVKVTKVFEFAGEEIKIEEEVPANSVEATKAALLESKNTTKEPAATKRPLGLSGVVSLLDSKKQKLTTLEKTKLDWNRFKSSEGIEEELETHKKSKAGYLEKQEFLERADLRQFEIEKSMRISKRSNR